ncbi:hypothetical protein BGZ83_002079 [Gryganskiella cystojenkinii]|nr:hypothetical protein BGZ83_002079 [Gryganskiella cystojenkinii]
MSSPISRTDSPSQDEHAKRKRDEQDALDKQNGESTLTSEGETLPPKKIKPESEFEVVVSKAEVKHIQRNLKTMPLEDGGVKDKDMDEVESENGSTGEATPDATQETPSSSTTQGVIDRADSRNSSDAGDEAASEESSDISRSASATTTTTTTRTEPKMTGGFSNTSSASPFANVKSGENVFGGSSSASGASPFAAVGASTNVFGDSKPSAFSGGFSNISSISPFASAAASKNVFGESSSSASVFGSSNDSVFGGDPAATTSAFGSDSSTTKSVFGSASDSNNVFGSSSGFGSSQPSQQGSESTAGSVFGARSVVGSVGNPSQSLSASQSAFGIPSQSSTTSSQPSSFGGTFGAKTPGFGKEASFLGSSETQSQDQGDFGDLLSQQQAEEEGDQLEDNENDSQNFATGVFSNAELIDVQTGEEDEINICSTKGKLYADADKSQTWKERGRGTFKVNVGRKDAKIARLVMRADGVLRLILNVGIFPDMNVIITGDKYIRFVGVESGKPVSFLLKVRVIL